MGWREASLKRHPSENGVKLFNRDRLGLSAVFAVPGQRGGFPLRVRRVDGQQSRRSPVVRAAGLFPAGQYPVEHLSSESCVCRWLLWTSRLYIVFRSPSCAAAAISSKVCACQTLDENLAELISRKSAMGTRPAIPASAAGHDLCLVGDLLGEFVDVAMRLRSIPGQPFSSFTQAVCCFSHSGFPQGKSRAF
jgi:hypothetical protein